MRTSLVVSAALVVVMGCVSVNLWRGLRTERLQVSDLKEQLVQAEASLALAEASLAQAVQAQAEAQAQQRRQQQLLQEQQQRMLAARPAPVTTARPALPPVPVMLPQPAGPLPPPPVVTASVRQPLVGATYEERRADALLQSDVTATARVRAWSTVLNLSPEQLQALSETAMAELRRETEESLEIDSRSGSMDAQAAAQLKVETLNRQHDTNLRILEKMTPHMSQEQSERMRLMFEAWVQPRLAAARAEQEQAAFPRN